MKPFIGLNHLVIIATVIVTVVVIVGVVVVVGQWEKDSQ